MQLQHLHLSVPDVTAVAAFFVDHFGFDLQEVRGHNGFAILTSARGFVLALMRLSPDVPFERAYPPMFHVGFVVEDEATLHHTHAGLVAAGVDASAIEDDHGSRRFYCRAPGGLLVEVGRDPTP